MIRPQMHCHKKLKKHINECDILMFIDHLKVMTMTSQRCMWAHGSVLFMTASGTKVRTFDHYANKHK